MADAGVDRSRAPDSAAPGRPWTCGEVAAAARCAEKTVRAMVQAGSLSAVRIGRRVFVPAAEVARLLAGGDFPTPPRRRGDRGSR